MFNQLPAPLNIAALDAGRVVPFKGWDVYQDVFFSTKPVPIGGQPAGVPLVFFDGAEGGGIANLTNVAGPTALIQGGHRFHGIKLFVTPIVEAAVVPVPATLDGTGLVRDLDRVLKTGRPVLSYTSTRVNKSRGNIPLDMIGEAGGVLPDFGGNNAPAAGQCGDSTRAVRGPGRMAAGFDRERERGNTGQHILGCSRGPLRGPHVARFHSWMALHPSGVNPAPVGR